MKMKRLSVPVLSLLVIMQAWSAEAVTISFIEDGEFASANVDVPICESATTPLPCKLPPFPQRLESATVIIQVLLGLFSSPTATALLIEPSGIPGEVAGSISDQVTITISSGPTQLVNIEFTSDTETGSFPASGFAGFTVIETGGEIDLTEKFSSPVIVGSANRVPYPLPAGYRITVQSDVIPEPSTWLLLGTGLVGLAFARKKLAGRACPQC